MAIGEAIRKARKARGFTLKQLAKEAGIANNTLFNWEHDFVSPNVMSLIYVADVLNISLDKLVGREQDDFEGDD